MSFVFRGTRTDIENAFPGIIPERRVRIHAARPVNTNSLAFLVTVLLLFMILNSHQMSPNFLLWLVFGFFLMATSLRMYATCQQLQAQAQAHAVAASGLLRHTELRLHMPPSIAFASRGRLQGLRLQLALLDREFDDLDYETLRALDADNAPSVPSMSDEEINALPVHKYKVGSSQSDLAATQQASSSSLQKQQDISIDVGNSKGSCEDELTCSVCLEQVNVGELIRSLPCLHQATKSLFSAPLSHLIGVRTIDNENHRSRQNLGLTASTDILGPVCHVRTLEDLSFPACHRPPLKRKSKYHASCIDPWLRQQGTCPVCKFKVGGGWHEDAQDGVDASYMV